MTRPDQPGDSQSKDALVQRYRDAAAHDTRRPAARVGAAVRAHAQMQLAQVSSTDASAANQPAGTSRPPPANQSRWKLSMLASIALAGLTSLLVLQFERGTDDEKKIAFGQRAPAESAAPPSLPTPAPTAPPPSPPPDQPPAVPPGAATTMSPSAPAISSEKTARPQDPPKPVERSARPAQPQAPNAAIAPSPGSAPWSSPAASLTPPAFPVSPQLPVSPASKSEALAETAPAGVAAAPGLADDAAARVSPRPASPPAPSAALRAPAPLQKQNSLSAEAARERSDRSASREDSGAPNAGASDAARDPKAALQQAARSGSTAQLDRLLARGMSLQPVLNAPDSAGRTPLIIAVLGGHAVMVQRLLAMGANPSLVDQGGLNALQHARQRGRSDLAALIEAAS